MGSAIKLLWASACFALALTACDGEEQVKRPEIVRPVKTVVIGEAEGSGVRRFPARIEASRRADVSFRVPGKVIELDVKEGERVAQRQVIARLDPGDYDTVVNDRQAQFTRVEKDFGRAKVLIKRGFISRQNYDRLEASFRSARSALKQAKLNQSYTTLRAPFAGEIARRFIEKFEEVKAKQPIFALRDTDALEVKFDVPEQIMIRLEGSTTDGKEVPEPEVFVEFDVRPGEKFPIVFKEQATTADPATRTFEATYTMETPAGLFLLPGMTATVSVDLSAYLSGSKVAYVPVEAVVGADNLAPHVWVVDKDTMTVGPRPVKVAAMQGGRIAITEGLKTGDRIVVSGVPFLVKGMKIREMPKVEQAVERADDLRLRREAEERVRNSKQATQPAEKAK